jgi:hypothetical protein
VDGGLTEKFDMGRDASYNFKVLFGFRAPGADTDGGVVDGPRWDVLTAFAADGSYSQVTEGGNLVCSPISAEFDDEEYQRAREAIEPDDDGVEWYFTTTEVTVTKSPDNHSQPIGQLNGIAVPLLDVFPAAVENQPTPPATYVKILMPSGKVGWIPAEVARPLSSDRLCYAKTPSGEWKIVAFDQSGN